MDYQQCFEIALVGLLIGGWGLLAIYLVGRATIATFAAQKAEVPPHKSVPDMRATRSVRILS
jgi:hypothetical protein